MPTTWNAKKDSQDPAVAPITWPYHQAPQCGGTYRGVLCGMEFRVTLKTLPRHAGESHIQFRLDPVDAAGRNTSPFFIGQGSGPSVGKARRHLRPFIRNSIAELMARE